MCYQNYKALSTYKVCGSNIGQQPDTYVMMSHECGYSFDECVKTLNSSRNWLMIFKVTVLVSVKCNFIFMVNFLNKSAKIKLIEKCTCF